MGSTEMPCLQQLFAVADCVECRRTRADGSDAQATHSPDHSANRGEAVQIATKDVRIGRFSVQRGERVGKAVLLQVIADRHLSAEAVAPVADGHGARPVGSCLHEDGHGEAGHAEGIGDSAFIPEIRERDDDTVNRVPVFAKEFSAQRAASGRVSTAPCLRSSGPSAITR